MPASRKMAIRPQASGVIVAAVFMLFLFTAVFSALTMAATIEDYDVVFAQPFGSPENYGDTTPKALIRTRDGGYAAAGTANATVAPPDGESAPGISPWLVRFNAKGVIQWQRTVAYSHKGIGHNKTNIAALVETSDGGFLLAGETDLDELAGAALGDPAHAASPRDYHRGDAAIVLKYNRDGKLLWRKTVGPVHADAHYAFYHAVAVSGGYVLLGGHYTSQHTPPPRAERGKLHRENPLWLVKIDDAGDVLWDRTYDNLQSSSAVGGQAYSQPFATEDGGMVFMMAAVQELSPATPAPSKAGSVNTLLRQRILALKFDRNGNEQARTAIPVPGGYAVLGAGPRGYLGAGRQLDDRNTSLDDQHTWLAALDKDLHLLWDKRILGEVFYNPLTVLSERNRWRLLLGAFKQNGDEKYVGAFLAAINGQGEIENKIELNFAAKLKLSGYNRVLPLLVSAGEDNEYAMIWQRKVYDVSLVKIRLKT